MKEIRIKRVYQEASEDDGLRILIDRLWPRGIKKEEAAVDLWLKDIAPSTELRKWFNHEVEKWPAFKKAYLKEVKSKPETLQLLKDKAKEQNITLIYAAKDEKHNDAVVLQEFLKQL